MLVIRPGHVSTKLSVSKALDLWEKENDNGGFERAHPYNGLAVEIRQVSKETYLDAMSRIRTTADLDDEMEIYRAMGLLVSHAVAQLHGLVDEHGKPVMLESESGVLTKESLELIQDNNMVMDLWRVARQYNDLSADEKKLFSGRALPI